MALDDPSESNEQPTSTSVDDDERIVKEWVTFLDRYSKGDFPPINLQDLKPSLPSPKLEENLEFKLSLDFETPAYPPGQIIPDTAKTISVFYSKHSFLPPPRSDTEMLRIQTIRKYNLYAKDQISNFDRCTSLVNMFFNRDVTFSLFKGNAQVVMSVAGNFPVERGFEMPPETGICSHVVLRRDLQIVELSEVVEDWRFTGNPWCKGGFIGGYVGVPIMLEVDPSSTAEHSASLPVGVLAVLDTKPIPTLTEKEKKMLEDISIMLSIQIRSTWEGWRRGKENTLRASVSEFLELALVKPLQSRRRAFSFTRPEAATTEPNDVADFTSNTALLEAAQRLRRDLPAEIAIIFDLSTFHATDDPCPRYRWLKESQTSRSQFLRPSGVMASNMDSSLEGCEKWLATNEGMNSVATFLSLHAEMGQVLFDERILSPRDGGTPAATVFKSLLPVPMTYIAIPFYVAKKPDILILVGSSNPLLSFSQTDVTFVSNLGVILVANFLQTRVVEADAAKTTFVSQISHELRTPLHGLLSQLELLKDSLGSGDTDQALAILESAEYCGSVLQAIVNDVLDFGKMSRITHTSSDPATGSPHMHSSADIAELVLDAAQSCWRRMRHKQTSSGVTDQQRLSVELFVQCEDRSTDGWEATLDVPGLRRILYNLIDNSLKYTTQGTIVVSVSSTGEKVSDMDVVKLEVVDSGCGIEESFLARMYDPFTQATTFSAGVGLGLYITKSIVSRMGGRLTVQTKVEQGSTFTVTFPVRFKNHIPEFSSIPPAIRRLIADPPPRIPSPLKKVVERVAPIPPPKPEADQLRALVVDDDAVNRRILVTLFSRLKIITREAEDGLVAIDQFKALSPHIVITDISMPKMDGVTAAKEMRKIEKSRGSPPAYIAALTGLGTSDETRRKEGLLGDAALDQWLVKGQSNLKAIREIVALVKAKVPV